MIKTTFVGLLFFGTLVVSCGSKEEVKKENTVPNVQPQKVGELKIAFYDQDSLKESFKYYKEQDAIVTKKQLAFQKEIERRTAKMQVDYENYMKRAQNNELSQVEIEGYQANLQNQEIAIRTYQEREGAKLEKETMEKLEAIGNKIEKFSEKYCKENGIDILLVHAKGGQFNYINPSMNVTKEFTAYLNQNQAAIEKEMGKK